MSREIDHFTDHDGVHFVDGHRAPCCVPVGRNGAAMMKEWNETVAHGLTCNLTLGGKNPYGCTCGLWDDMGRRAMWDDATLLGELTQRGRLVIETASPDSSEWRMPDGMPWTLTVVTYNKVVTEAEELGEDEWLHYGGGSLGSAVRTAWEDLQSTVGEKP